MPQDKKKPIIVNDKNDPRLKAYNDSLKAFNWTSEKIKINKSPSGGNLLPNPKIITNDDLIKKVGKDKFNKFMLSEDGIAPENILNFKTDLGTTYSMANYKKPVQPVVYQKPQPKTQERAPIVVTNPNDPRLKAYSDSLDLYGETQRNIKRLQIDNNSNVESYGRVAPGKKYPNVIEPINRIKVNGSCFDIPNYKKPVQPVILEDKPKLEAIKPIGYKPINTFIQPKLAGNIIVPEIPKSNTVVQNYTAGKQLEKMKKPTGYVNQGNKQGIQEFKNGGKLNPLEENAFQKEYKLYSQKTGNSPNPDDPEHYYDYRRLFEETGSIMNHLSNDNHLPSEYKTLGHPNLYIKGRNTKTETFQQGGQLDTAGMANSAISAIPQLMQGVQQPSGPEKGKTVGKTIGSTAGGIGGAIAGSVLLPGVGTIIGGSLGSMLGGLAGGGIGKMVGNQNQEFKQETNQFMNGGKLTHLKGLTHEQGGIQLTNNNEVEHGETKINDFIFSNNLLYGKKQTFADKSKSIDKKYFRDNDKIDAMGKKLELEKLSNQQENMKKSMIMSELSSKYMNGGKLKKKYFAGGDLTDEQMAKYPDLYNQVLAKRKLMNELKPSSAMTPDDGVINLDGSTEPILSSPTVSKGSGLSTPTFNNSNSINPNITSNITDPKTMDVFSNKPNYGNILPQLAGDAFNITQGLKGGDDVNFQRVTPYLTNSKPAIASMNNATSTSFNNARNAIRNNATSSGEYLAQMNSLSGAESLKRGVGIAGIKAEYDKINSGIMNQTSSQNAGIQMNEADARQRETDAARSAVSKGLSDMGSKIGSINNEKNARINQKDLLSLMSKNGYKLTRDVNGELGFEKNGTHVPYEIAIGSVFQPQTKG